MGGEKNSSLVCVYSCLCVCFLDTNLLAGSSSSSSQTGKQAVTEGRKEGSFACLRACEAVAFNWKISNSCGSNSKNGLFAKFGMCQIKMGSVVGVSSWGVCPQESTTVL